MARQRACALRARGSSATVVAPERCPSGRRGTPGERVYPQGTEGSNPSLSAPKGPVFTRLSSDGGAGFQEGSKESAGRPSAVDAETDGSGVPGFVVNEFRKFLRCGVLAHGFARVRCGDCAFERLVPFSCKGRAICPSCGGRRMTERAMHLVDHVSVRQWVLSVPHRLCYRLAYDHRLCRTVLSVFVRALRSGYRRRARSQGLSGGETGMVTSVQRFGGALNAHIHFHTLVLDGVFVREPDGTLRFHPAAPPTDDDVRRVVGRIRRRLERLGLAGTTRRDEDRDPLADESAAWRGLPKRRSSGGPPSARARAGGPCGSEPTRMRRGSSATSRSTPTTVASTSMPPSMSRRAIASGSSASASISAARRSARAASAGCATGGSPSASSGHGRTGRRISCSRRWSFSNGSSRSCRALGSTCCSITASWPRTRRGAARWSRAPSPSRARSTHLHGCRRTNSPRRARLRGGVPRSWGVGLAPSILGALSGRAGW